MTDRKVITIGIPCYQGVPAETLEDYMRFAYHLGRRYQEYDFFLAIKSKSEQFRARNAIVEAALQAGSDYILMLDDDHVIDHEGHLGPNDRYDFLRKLIDHDKPVIGALYYQRGGECHPVLMTKFGQGYRFLKEEEITGGLMEVDVQGGGCILMKAEIFDRIPSPWFEPELDFGTDIQICQKARDAGFSVWCDTSLELGHVLSARSVVTSKNRKQHIEKMAEQWEANLPQDAWFKSYRKDIESYLEELNGGPLSVKQLQEWHDAYFIHMNSFGNYEDKAQYYIDAGLAQLLRQYWFHSGPWAMGQAREILPLFDDSKPERILDFGCGSAPIGFELAKRGHHLWFVDIDGAGGFEFLKWRARQQKLFCQFKWWINTAFDTLMLLDSLEHMEDWMAILSQAVDCGIRRIVTNFFELTDDKNVEHINMDKTGVALWLKDHGFDQTSKYEWKRSLT